MKKIVCLSTSPWYPIPTRKQQVMSRLSDAEILYFDPPVTYLAPLKDPAATLIKDITYTEALEKGLKVMDASAFALCAENKVPMVRVFGLDDPENLLRVLEGSDIGTFVHP